MDPRFLPHNSHRESPRRFSANDPQLRHLTGCPFRHRSALLDRVPRRTPGIFTLGGGRQTGKSTLLKQWMAELLDDGVPPMAVSYLSGELIDDHHSLMRHIEAHLAAAPDSEFNYLIVDEVTYIRDWDKTVKYAADAGMLDLTALVVTGSDLSFLQEARMRFPGRRGDAAVNDFHLRPLSFNEFVALEGRVTDLDHQFEEPFDLSHQTVDLIFDAFDRYLLHGGYLTAINDMATHGAIRQSTLATYLDRIRGDVLKRGKQEAYLREVLSAIVTRYTSQVTWNGLAQDLSIDHPKTVADYVELLERMDAVAVLPALREDKLGPAPKKAKKLTFCDPFILHAVRAWLEPSSDPSNQILAALRDPVWASQIVEACVANHFKRFFPTYYIKAQGEVDIAYVRDGRFWPVVVKWTTQLRPKTLKQIARYDNGVIWSKSRHVGEIEGIEVRPLPVELLRTGQSATH
ncbi:MAG: ATP-binding protein [Gammaproteobacteria bacterium]|nr:ATP-binding protein [Gammaproteobacteria bacterium]